MNRTSTALAKGETTLERLEKELAISSSRHPEFPSLVQLTYDQIDSPKADPFVLECRGLILDEADGWRVAARPFDRFFNHGEVQAAKVDWATASFQKKEDGTLIIAYDHGGQWQVATRGMPDAGGQVNGFGFTFRELFWRTMAERGYHLPSLAGWRNVIGKPYPFTLLFELVSPYNRIVVRHERPDLVLIGFRDNGSGAEITPAIGRAFQNDSGGPMPPAVQSWRLGTIEEAIKSFDAIDPIKHEGYVVVDANFNRLKVKHPGYVALHHLRDGMGPKALLELVRRNESTEFLASFPEWTQAHAEVKRRYDLIAGALEATYELRRGIKDQKEFALAVKDLRYSGALFSLRAGKTPSVRHWLSEIPIAKLAEGLQLGDVELEPKAATL